MKKLIIVLLCSLTLFAQNKGHLLIIGGGTRPDYMMKRFIQLAGGNEAKIVVIPNASEDKLAEGIYHASELIKLGAKNTEIVMFSRKEVDEDSVLKKFDGATGIFFAGGDQANLTRDMLGTKMLAKIKKIYKDGGIIGGTSAGAAVQSKVMITGNELISKDSSYSFAVIQKGNTETVEGFGFVTEAIIDQHFVRRKRHNRLLEVVFENPKLLGVGIDESTAILVNPDRTCEVIGENSVLIYDARKSKISLKPGSNIFFADKLQLRILGNGEKFSLLK